VQKCLKLDEEMSGTKVPLMKSFTPLMVESSGDWQTKKSE
jgi:hypothetical protein